MPNSNLTKMLKIAGYVFIILALMVAASGYMFIKSFDISSSRLTVIEASILQVGHLRYAIGAILAVASAVCFATVEIKRN